MSSGRQEVVNEYKIPSNYPEHAAIVQIHGPPGLKRGAQVKPAVRPNSLVAPVADDIRHAFVQYDSDNSGYIELRELEHALRGLGIDSSLESDVLKKYDANRSGRLDILEFNKLVLDMRLERDELIGSQQAIRPPTADQPVPPIGGYGGYGDGGGYGGQAALAPDIPLGSTGSMGSLQARRGVAPADQPLGLVGGRAGVAPEHRATADQPLPIGGRSGFAPGYRPEADQPLGGRAGYAPTYRTGLN